MFCPQPSFSFSRTPDTTQWHILVSLPWKYNQNLTTCHYSHGYQPYLTLSLTLITAKPSYASLFIAALAHLQSTISTAPSVILQSCASHPATLRADMSACCRYPGSHPCRLWRAVLHVSIPLKEASMEHAALWPQKCEWRRGAPLPCAHHFHVHAS